MSRILRVGKGRYRPDIDGDDRSRRDVVPVVLVIRDRTVGQRDWGYGMPAEEFLEHRVHVRKRGFVREGRKAVSTDDTVELLLRFLLNLWMHRHGQEEDLEGRVRLRIYIRRLRERMRSA